VGEHDGAVQEHEPEEAAHGPVEKPGATLEVGRRHPPPEGVGGPHHQEGVVEKDAAAPGETDDLARLA
jgi:hypothetical protein